MRILVASPYLPWPLGSGGNVAQFSTLQCLSHAHAFTLVCPVYTQTQLADAKELSAQLEKVRIRAVFCGIPLEPARRSLWERAAALAKRFRPRAPASAETAPNLYYPFYPLPKAFLSVFAEELALAPDLVQCEFAEMMPLGTWLPREIPRLFVHHQIHHVYARRFLEIHGGSAYSRYLAAWMHAQEIMYLRAFDAVITFSEKDRETLGSALEIERIYCSPFPIPGDVGIAHEVSGKFNGRFLFIGSEAHGPNQDALSWLLTDIWPDIASRLPVAELVVIGNWSERWRNLSPNTRVTFPGFVANLSAAFQEGIMLVPLRIGSGIRTKILASLAQGVPTITTAVGCEGLLVSDGREVLIRDEAKSFADTAVQLAGDRTKCLRLAEAGLRLVSQHYSPAEVRRQRNEIYRQVVEKSGRTENPKST